MSDKQSPKIIIDEDIPFIRGVLEPYAHIQYVPGQAISNHILHQAEGLIVRTRTKCNEALLTNTAVRFIGSATTGKDHVDETFCRNAGIHFEHAPGCNAVSVLQYVAAALSVIMKKVSPRPSQLTLGIVGAGHIGSRVSKISRALGFNVLINDPPRARAEGDKGFCGLQTVLKQSDIITLHVPLVKGGQDATYHMVNDAFLQMMKAGSYLINTSRGPVADTEALKLNADRIHYVLDVWEKEPDIDLFLLEKAFLATPHIAGYSVDGKANGTQAVVRAAANFFGWPLKDWSPSIPVPEDPVIKLPASTETECKVFDVILKTYDIDKDDKALRNVPEEFDRWRNQYPVRWEFPHYIAVTQNKTCKELYNHLGLKNKSKI
jgi:erythronate-4-phosphate dehydrogenase